MDKENERAGTDHKNSYAGIDPVVVRIAKSAARKVIGKHGFTESDRSDLEQELVSAGLKAMERFDPELGNGGGLVAMAVKSKLNAILIYRYAQKRDWRKCCSLDVEISGHAEDDEASTMIELLSSEGNFGPPGREECDPFWQQTRCRDVNAAIGYMPSELRELCEDLKTMTPEEVLEHRDLTLCQFHCQLGKVRRFFLCFLGEDEFGDPPENDQRPLNWW